MNTIISLDKFVGECYLCGKMQQEEKLPYSILSFRFKFQGDEMATKSIRINEKLISQAHLAGALQHRSIPNQLEYWATLGKMISTKIDMEDALAILQGLKKIKVEAVHSAPVDSDSVFAKLEADRAAGFKNKRVTQAPFFYEASKSQPGYIDKVNTQTGERTTGQFQNGFFEVVNA